MAAMLELWKIVLVAHNIERVYYHDGDSSEASALSAASGEWFISFPDVTPRDS
jgi:hypothetical protein